ncbi:unnamed protein product [Closterium sp. Yama58-4]|nr:unnamed protein product [Closterium sp. Yama58-4]
MASFHLSLCISTTPCSRQHGLSPCPHHHCHVTASDWNDYGGAITGGLHYFRALFTSDCYRGFGSAAVPSFSPLPGSLPCTCHGMAWHGMAPQVNGMALQRVWVQGVLRSADAASLAAVPGGEVPTSAGGSAAAEGRLYLDDGSAAVEIVPAKGGSPPLVGSYVQVIGALCTRPASPPFIKVHKLVDLSADPNRESLWHLEVIEAHIRSRPKPRT